LLVKKRLLLPIRLLEISATDISADMIENIRKTTDMSGTQTGIITHMEQLIVFKS
jgi:hypothetical protein